MTCTYVGSYIVVHMLCFLMLCIDYARRLCCLKATSHLDNILCVGGSGDRVAVAAAVVQRQRSSGVGMAMVVVVIGGGRVVLGWRWWWGR